MITHYHRVCLYKYQNENERKKAILKIQAQIPISLKASRKHQSKRSKKVSNMKNFYIINYQR